MSGSRWRPRRAIAPLAVVSVILLSMGCLVPPSANLQSARCVGKAGFRFTPYWTSVHETGDDKDKIADGYGLLLGVGAGDASEIQFRYERTVVEGLDFGDGYNFVSAGPKFALVDQNVSFLFPFGLWFGDGIDEGETFQVHPGVIGTFAFEDVAEFSLAARYFWTFNEDLFDVFVVNFDVGLSSDTSRWAIIPEMGLTWNTSSSDNDPLIHYAIAVAVYTQ